MKIKETLQSFFGFILLLSPIILFWYIDWYEKNWDDFLKWESSKKN